VSGVKSKVEGLCQRFEKDPDSIDLSEEHPNGIANVLKLYLREVSKAISILFTPASISIKFVDQSDVLNSQN
jgi:hypothetical protein